MATLQKFKLLATQCAIAGSPSRSPTTSPVFQLRRRKTLRMLLSRSSSSSVRRLPRPEQSPDRQGSVADPPEEKKDLLSHSLKDLFISSPPFEDNGKVTERKIRDNREGIPTPINRGGGLAGRRGGAGSPWPISSKFRYRLLRRAWRPVLVTIPE
ncbi:hypothetical protein HHK36_024620 [Tetracentron sinense]|uniref:Uncharacterized protein n=1 Tax=Tetracentron sinense TaxID=13715 RepID=A0A834YPE5_TETSI|nr:hypothetical protein HHK36_024620 [Tetracentron sinense]